MRQTMNRAAALAALVALGALTACTPDDRRPPGAAPSADVGPDASSTPDPGYTVIAAAHLDGPGRWAMPAAGDPEAPLAVIDVPDGFQGREGMAWTHDDLDLQDLPGQVLYQAPTRVFTDPCDPDRPSPRLGPTVEDLAQALTAQKRTTTSSPVPVTLGGYRGLYLELTATEGFDSKTCTAQGGMVVLEAGAGRERGLDFPAIERFWILDVNGRRVVLSAMTPAGARAPSVERVTDVAEAVTFVDATG